MMSNGKCVYLLQHYFTFFLAFSLFLQIEIKKLKTEQAMKEKDLVPVLQENKCLADVIIKTKKEIDAIEKKMKNHISKKVTVSSVLVSYLFNIWCLTNMRPNNRYVTYCSLVQGSFVTLFLAGYERNFDRKGAE